MNTSELGPCSEPGEAALQVTSSRRVLLVTPLDPRVHLNSMEEHRARAWAATGAQVTVISKLLDRSTGLAAFLRRSLTSRVDESTDRDGPASTGVTWIALDPFLNGRPGLRTAAEERSANGGARLALLRLLSPLGILRELTFVAAAARVAAQRGRFELCIGVGPWGALAGRILRRLGRVDLVLHLDRDLEAGLVPDPLRRWLTERVERSCVRHADLVHSTARRLVERRAATSGRRPRYLPNGVHAERFERPREEGDAAERLVYVGNLIAWSGLAVDLEAFARLRARRPRAELWIAGGGLGGFRAQLERRARELGVADTVRLLGPIAPEDLPELLARSSVGLANSVPVEVRRHATPLKLLEFMAAGLPVLATRDTEAGDLVEEWGVGVAVEHAVEPVERALEALLADRARREALGSAGRRVARELCWSSLVAEERAAVEACFEARAARRGEERRA